MKTQESTDRRFIMVFASDAARQIFINRLKRSPIHNLVNYSLCDYMPEVIVHKVPVNHVNNLKDLTIGLGIVLIDKYL